MKNIDLTLQVSIKCSKEDNPNQSMDIASGISQEDGERILDHFHQLMYKHEKNGYAAMHELLKDDPRAGNILFSLGFAYLFSVHVQMREQEELCRQLEEDQKQIKKGVCPMWNAGISCNICKMYDNCILPVKRERKEK